MGMGMGMSRIGVACLQLPTCECREDRDYFCLFAAAFLPPLDSSASLVIKSLALFLIALSLASS
jgi:hypothetical protein